MIVQIKKMMKNDEKKCHLNNENPNQIVSPGKKKLIRPHMFRHK